MELFQIAAEISKYGLHSTVDVRTSAVYLAVATIVVRDQSRGMTTAELENRP